MALRPASEIIQYFKALTHLDTVNVFSLVSAQVVSFFIRKNALYDSSKLLILELFMANFLDHHDTIITELITTTVNKHYPQYRKNRNLLRLYNLINNELKEKIHDTIIYATYDIAQRYGLVSVNGANFRQMLTTGTQNTWVINEAYNASGIDPKPDYILINPQNTTTTAVPPPGLTVPSSTDTSKKGLYYMLNSDPNQILFFTTDSVNQWHSAAMKYPPAGLREQPKPAQFAKPKPAGL